MNPNLVLRRMIAKDFALHRPYIVASLVSGAVALATLLVKTEQVTVVGTVLFFIVLIVISCMLPASNILNERKKQTLPFVMSMPMSCTQYTTAKLLSTMSMYLLPWSILAGIAVWLIDGRGVLPVGSLPMAAILLGFPLVGLTIITALTLVGETEGWNMVGNLVCNSSYGLTWYFMTKSPALMEALDGSKIVWNRTRLAFLGWELGVIVAILAVTYFLQSRKRDFV